MDPVTHMLTGACLGRSGFNRKSALTTVTMVLAAEAADLDVLWEIKGSIAGLQHHRGITHSFVGVPFVAAAVLAFVYLLHRRRTGNPQAETKSEGQRKPSVRWGYLYFCAVVAALSHLLLDYTTAYGIRMFEPFNFHWYSWDIVYIVEPLILIALIAGLALPSLFGLINQEIGARKPLFRGRAGAITALVCMILIWAVRDFQHRRALSAMDSFLYRGAQPTRLAAYPYMVDPFRWHGVVETDGFFETVPVDSRQPEVSSNAGQMYYKRPDTAATTAAKSSYLGHVYLDWAAFPYVEEGEWPGSPKSYLVEFQDLRYSYPSMKRAPLTGYVLLNSGLRVLEQGMSTSHSPSIKAQRTGDAP